MVFIDFETESSSSCSHDFLVIYDGDSITDSEIGTYCGTNSPGCVTSSTENLLITFETDGSVTRRGFLASFNFQSKCSMF